MPLVRIRVDVLVYARSKGSDKDTCDTESIMAALRARIVIHRPCIAQPVCPVTIATTQMTTVAAEMTTMTNQKTSHQRWEVFHMNNWV